MTEDYLCVFNPDVPICHINDKKLWCIQVFSLIAALENLDHYKTKFSVYVDLMKEYTPSLRSGLFSTSSSSYSYSYSSSSGMLCYNIKKISASVVFMPSSESKNTEPIWPKNVTQLLDLFLEDPNAELLYNFKCVCSIPDTGFIESLSKITDVEGFPILKLENNKLVFPPMGSNPSYGAIHVVMNSNKWHITEWACFDLENMKNRNEITINLLCH